MLAGRLQRYATPLAARMENPVRVRHDLSPAPGSGAALCRRLRASSRRSHRPRGQVQLPERTQNWIKLGGKVNNDDMGTDTFSAAKSSLDQNRGTYSLV